MITTSRSLVNPITYSGKNIPDDTLKGSGFLRHTTAKYLVFFTVIGDGVKQRDRSYIDPTFFLLLDLTCGDTSTDDLCSHVIRYFRVVTKFHRVARATLRHRAHLGGVTEHRGKRHFGVNLLH